MVHCKIASRVVCTPNISIYIPSHHILKKTVTNLNIVTTLLIYLAYLIWIQPFPGGCISQWNTGNGFANNFLDFLLHFRSIHFTALKTKPHNPSKKIIERMISVPCQFHCDEPYFFTNLYFLMLSINYYHNTYFFLDPHPCLQ